MIEEHKGYFHINRFGGRVIEGKFSITVCVYPDINDCIKFINWALGLYSNVYSGYIVKKEEVALFNALKIAFKVETIYHKFHNKFEVFRFKVSRK